MKRFVWLAAWIGLALAVSAGSVRAESVEDILTLARKGLGEEVLLAAVERNDAGYSLSPDQIIKLKEAGVSEKVIAAMLRRKAVAPPAPAGPPVAVAPPVTVPATAPSTPAAMGAINLENVDERAWSCQLDGAARIVWIGSGDNRGYQALPAHGGLTLNAPAGNYEVRYAGEAAGSAFVVAPNEKVLVLVSRVETAEFEGLYASVFEKGERRSGARLVTLRQTRKGAEAQTAYEYQPAQTQVVREKVVERVVEQPTRTVIYETEPAIYPVYTSYYWYRPAYYSDYWHRPAYYHPGYVPAPPPRHRSGLSVGVGVRF